MRSRVFGSVLALALGVPGVALAAPLPLQDGEYSRAPCAGGVPGINDSIGVYVLDRGRDRGKQFVVPAAEDQFANCTLGRVKVSGDRYSGRAPCTAGSREMDSGDYDFDFRVVDRRTFVSRGATYRWCAAHR